MDGYIRGSLSTQFISLKYSSVAFLHHQIEFGLEFGIEVMLDHVRNSTLLTPGKTTLTGFWTASAEYCATSSLMIIFGIPFAAAASAISWEWQELSRLEKRKAASSTVWPTVRSLECAVSPWINSVLLASDQSYP